MAYRLTKMQASDPKYQVASFRYQRTLEEILESATADERMVAGMVLCHMANDRIAEASEVLMAYFAPKGEEEMVKKADIWGEQPQLDAEQEAMRASQVKLSTEIAAGPLKADLGLEVTPPEDLEGDINLERLIASHSRLVKRVNELVNRVDDLQQQLLDHGHSYHSTDASG